MYRTVVVAVVTVRVMQSAIDYIVRVVAMGNGLVSAAGPMDMGVFMLDRLTSVRIGFVNV